MVPSHPIPEECDVLYCVNFRRLVSRICAKGRQRLNDSKLTCSCARVLLFLQCIYITDNPTKLWGNNNI